MKYSPKSMEEKLKKYDFGLKKKFGQNFIIDQNIINSIIKKSGIDKDITVLEIGPGAGSLTYHLSKNAKNVLCYEIDNSVKKVLDETLSEVNNVKVIYEDFLKADVKKELSEIDFNKLYVVANLPYYITTPIINKIIEEKIPVEKLVVMVQKEVGNRMKAEPGTKEYNSLSIYLNYYFDIKKELDVSRNVFLPKPNVDSIVISLTKKENRFKLDNETLFFDFVKESFTQKRKTLKNNIKKYNLEIIEKVLNRYNLDLSVRAEQLSIKQFVEIANALNKEEN